MRELVFATNNGHKLQEIRSMLNPGYRISGLAEKGIIEEIPEDHFTLEENAFQKAEFVWKRVGSSCFADDTGLEIDALQGEPGVFSARYSLIGQPVYSEMEVTAGNIRKVLEKLHGETNRKARFRTVIALIMDGHHHSFEGAVDGSITDEGCGRGGFGYDPIFIPDGSRLTFAEMEPSHKNRISHRALAVKKLVNFLTSTDPSDGLV
ncbi:MAG: RdgB/HAM1 family non-canonical purine NTP pyrophosphatase [Bacteroidales bacterium]